MNDTELQRLLKADGLEMAEQLTGKDYKTDKLTQSIGMLNHFGLVAQRISALEEVDDTRFVTPLPEYLRIVGEEGFEKCLELDFVGHETPEKYYIFFQPRLGVLLAFDTYGGGSVNSGKFYYNCAPTDTDEFYKHTSSGFNHSVENDYVWVGDHDCREALRFHIRMLGKYSTFVTPWVNQPFLWLLHYMDTKVKGYDYKATNSERIAMLPEYVQKAILG